MSKYFFLAQMRARKAENAQDDDKLHKRYGLLLRELYVQLCLNNPQIINPPSNAYSLYDHRSTFNELLVRFPTRERWRSQFRFDLE